MLSFVSLKKEKRVSKRMRGMIDLIVDLLGYGGALLILITLFLTRKYYVKSQWVAIGGCLMLTLYGYLKDADAVMVLSIFWIGISLYNLLRSRTEKNVSR